MPEIMVYAAEFPFRSVISRCSRWTCVLPADPEAPSRTRSRGNQRGVLLSSAGRGSLHAGHDRGGVGDQVAGFLHDAGAGRDVHPELVRVGGLGADVVQL